MSMLTIDSLKAAHGQLTAVRGVSLAVEAGEILALVGANGAGKTTLLRTLAGAHPAAGGRVALKGRDITSLPSHSRVAAGIALVPEGRRLFSEMTVEENLRLGQTAGRSGPWALDRVFEAFPNLASRRSAKAGHLSGGEQQAVAIGRALMTNPDILLLDEVSLGLSPLAVDRVYRSLEGFIRSGLTVILVEQDLSRAMGTGTRAACMLEGEIVLDRPMAAVSRGEITDAYFGLHKRQGGTT